MTARAARPEKIGLEDVFRAVRTERLTGNTAGYGQVVSLTDPGDDGLRVMWHAAAGPVAAPFAPVFLGQGGMPAENGPHCYLTAGETRRFMDLRSAVSGGGDGMSQMSRANETTRSAFQESKRILYLMQALGDPALARDRGVFAGRERAAAVEVARYLKLAEAALAAGLRDEVFSIPGTFSSAELRANLTLVTDLCTSLAAEAAGGAGPAGSDTPPGFPQIR